MKKGRSFSGFFKQYSLPFPYSVSFIISAIAGGVNHSAHGKAGGITAGFLLI